MTIVSCLTSLQQVGFELTVKEGQIAGVVNQAQAVGVLNIELPDRARKEAPACVCRGSGREHRCLDCVISMPSARRLLGVLCR